MCTFGALEPISGANATAFASAIMKIQLRFGFCHTIVVGKDSKFFGVFKQSLDLLKINTHVISGDNHNAMIVERLCRYFNKGLRIMTNECGTVLVALESSSFFYMHGIHAQSQARTSLVALLQLAVNSPSRSIIRVANIGSLGPPR